MCTSPQTLTFDERVVGVRARLPGKWASRIYPAPAPPFVPSSKHRENACAALRRPRARSGKRARSEHSMFLSVVRVARDDSMTPRSNPVAPTVSAMFAQPTNRIRASRHVSTDQISPRPSSSRDARARSHHARSEIAVQSRPCPPKPRPPPVQARKIVLKRILSGRKGPHSLEAHAALPAALFRGGIRRNVP